MRWIPIVVALVSFAIFFPLGLLTSRWLKRRVKPACRHRWRVLIEKYPTFTQDRWKCDECGLCENFPHDKPPMKVTTEICNMGHLHVADVSEWDDEWPDMIDAAGGTRK